MGPQKRHRRPGQSPLRSALERIRPYTALLSALALAGTVQAARGDSGRPGSLSFETGLGPAPVVSYEACGADFVTTGVATRRTDTPPGIPGQSEPFRLDSPPPPYTSLLVRVFVVWHWLLDGEPPPTDVIVINGFSVVGTLFGTGFPDPEGTDASVVTYLANEDPDFGPIVHGFPNQIAGATDKPLGDDPLALGAGLSIVSVYAYEPSSFEPLRRVELYCGYASTASNPLDPGVAAMSLDFGAPYAGGDLHLFLTALGGEPGADALYLDGFPVGGYVAGTVEATDAWKGCLGPTPGILGYGYDHLDDDVSSLVAPGATSLALTTVAGEDDVGHSFAAISYPVAQTFELAGPGKPDGVGLVPVLTGEGPMTVGSSNALVLRNAQQLLPAALVVGFGPLDAPFLDGVLGPSPDIVLGGFVTGFEGNLTLPFEIDEALAPGLNLWTQFWIANPSATFGFSASNTLKVTVQ